MPSIDLSGEFVVPNRRNLDTDGDVFGGRDVGPFMLKLFKNLTGSNAGTGVRRAVAGDAVIAESEVTERVEGNHYFPPHAVNWDYLEPSESTSVCPWKGVASYYDVVVDGRRIRNAAWTYKTPSQAAASIKDHVAFWRGVKVVRD